MATSIRDLIDALECEAPYASGTDRHPADAAGALAELGRALRRLTQDGLELDINGRRETIARDLAESCTQNPATVQLDRSGRLTGLAGGLADIVGVLSEETGRDQRWAITVEIARPGPAQRNRSQPSAAVRGASRVQTRRSTGGMRPSPNSPAHVPITAS